MIENNYTNFFDIEFSDNFYGKANDIKLFQNQCTNLKVICNNVRMDQLLKIICH